MFRPCGWYTLLNSQYPHWEAPWGNSSHRQQEIGKLYRVLEDDRQWEVNRKGD